MDTLTNRFTRSKTSPENNPLDVSTHSSRYTRSALPQGKDFANPPHLTTLLFVFQLTMIFLFMFGTEYNTSTSHEYSHYEYVIYRDIMAMLLVGFGYLMTFLRKYGLGAVGFTMMLTALGMQLNFFLELLVRVMYDSDHADFPIHLDLFHVIDSEFFAATLLITYGGVIGRASPLQLLLIMIFEDFFYAINKVMVVFGSLEAEDVGGTYTIHMFGAYFGVALAKALGPQNEHTASNADARRFSDLLSLIGTTILWIYWPSFVGATETGVPENEERCVINCILALLGSTSATFFMSLYLGNRKFDVVHIANSTLAGGVAVGASARLDMGPGGALLLGVLAGLISVFGFFTLSPLLEAKFGITDTCGIHNLHGMPAVLGGFASAIFVATDNDADFLSHIASNQAGRQIAALFATVAIAASSGYLTGSILKLLNLQGLPEYDDSAWWWEGEFYEAVNTVDDEDYEDVSNKHDVSISKGDKTDDSNDVSPSQQFVEEDNV